MLPRLLFFLALSVPVAGAHAATLDDVLERLRGEIAAQPIDEPMPIDKVLARYQDETLHWFELPVEPDADVAPTPPARPQHVAPADWEAVLHFLQADDPQRERPVELGGLSLALADLDDDGHNDLLLSYYSGGTGLFSTIEVGRRHGDTFVFAGSDGTEGPRSYSINGRGGDQAVYFLRIDGRRHVGYRDGDYHGDLLTLDRPLSADPAERTPSHALRIDYRHRHRLAAPAGESPPADEAQRAILQDRQLLAAIERQLALLQFDDDGRQIAPDPGQRCPVPADSAIDGDTRRQWPWRFTGHYTFDFVADMRVESGGRCLGASLVAFRSSYMASYENCCQLWLFDAPGEQAASLELRSERRLHRVEIVPAGAG